MNSAVSRRSELEQAFAAGCDRFVPWETVDPAERARQRRLVGAVLVAPFLLAAAGAVILSNIGVMALLSAICAVFAASWSIALVVASARHPRLGEKLALAVGAVTLATLIAVAGGVVSPLAILALALPLEAFWVSRKREAVYWGLAALAAALVLTAPLQAILDLGTGATASAWHWIGPLAYVTTLALRLPSFGIARVYNKDENVDFRLEDHLAAVVLRMTVDGDVEKLSAQAERIMGIQPELLLGAGLFERIRVSDRVAFRCALADIKDGKEGRVIELRLRLPRTDDEEGGSAYRLFEMDLMGTDRPDDHAVAVMRPIAELAELREQLARANDAAGSTEISKGRFLATVSHELRTPLNAIIGFSDMMLHEAISGPLEPKQKEHLGLIRDAGRHLLSVVNSILDVSKIESGAYQLQPEPFCFKTAVALCQSMLQQQADEKKLTLTVRIAADIDEVRCDQRAAQQIIINLLSNAIKFTPAGGSVSLDATLENNVLVIAVSDTGIGIEEDDLERLGQPFMQVRNDYTRQYEGTGLGLCLVRGLVELHGGAMSIESAPGLGTSVTVKLPLDRFTDECVTTVRAVDEDHEEETLGDGHETLRKIA